MLHWRIEYSKSVDFGCVSQHYDVDAPTAQDALTMFEVNVVRTLTVFKSPADKYFKGPESIQLLNDLGHVERRTEVYKPGVLRTEFNGDVSERIIPVQPVDEAGLAMYTLICHIHASIRHCEEGECAPYALVQVRDWAQLHKWALAFETRWKAAGKVLPESIPAEPT